MIPAQQHEVTPFSGFRSVKQVKCLINVQSNGPTKNAERIVCTLLFLPHALRVHPFLQLHEYSGYLIHVIPQRALMKKGFTHSPISSRIKCRIPITSLKSLGRINSHLLQDFPIPTTDKTRKNWLTRPYMRMSSDSKPPHFLANSSVQTTSGNFSGFSKHIPVSKQQNTKQWHSQTKKAHKNPNKTKQNSKQNKTKQNSDSKQTKFKKNKKTTKTQKRSKATSSKHTQKKKQANKQQNHKPFSL